MKSTNQPPRMETRRSFDSIIRRKWSVYCNSRREGSEMDRNRYGIEWVEWVECSKKGLMAVGFVWIIRRAGAPWVSIGFIEMRR